MTNPLTSPILPEHLDGGIDIGTEVQTLFSKRLDLSREQRMTSPYAVERTRRSINR